jgi:hypothetical protein
LSEKRAICGKLGGTKSKKSGRKRLASVSNLLNQDTNSAFAKHKQAIARQEPQTPTTTTTLTTTPRKNTPKAPVLPDGFGVFWSAYPHFPQRSSRAEALRRWNAMKLEPIANDVMRALNACLEIPQWTRDGRSFVSAAEVWLRKRLWEQELATVSDSLIESIANDPRCK